MASARSRGAQAKVPRVTCALGCPPVLAPLPLADRGGRTPTFAKPQHSDSQKTLTLALPPWPLDLARPSRSIFAPIFARPLTKLSRGGGAPLRLPPRLPAAAAPACVGAHVQPRPA